MNAKEHIVRKDYSAFDIDEVLDVVFHPLVSERSDLPTGCVDHDLDLDGGVRLGIRFHLPPEKDGANIIFFHGNGEVVSDYDEVGPRFAALGLGFIVADYRGYGWSSGKPSVTSMIRDSYHVFDHVIDKLKADGRNGKILVMGRSLGCVPALELATFRQSQIAGLVIESGFANTCPLLGSIGVDTGALGISEENGFGNVLKISSVTKPVLVLHAQKDEVIPVSEGADLHAHCGSASKEIQLIPGAGHNNILEVTGRMYYQVIEGFARKIGQPIRRKRRGVR